MPDVAPAAISYMLSLPVWGSSPLLQPQDLCTHPRGSTWMGHPHRAPPHSFAITRAPGLRVTLIGRCPCPSARLYPAGLYIPAIPAQPALIHP